MLFGTQKLRLYVCEMWGAANKEKRIAQHFNFMQRERTKVKSTRVVLI